MTAQNVVNQNVMEEAVSDQMVERQFLVIHPLDDVHEQKIDTGHLGPMPMTAAVRVSLIALRGYLVLMLGLLAFRVLQLAEAIHV
jgi:hypothetical protein